MEYGDKMPKMSSIFRCLQTIFMSMFVLGLMATALNPQPEPPIVLGKMSSAVNLTNGGALFSGQTVAMSIFHQSCINCLNPEPETPIPIFLINASTSGGIFSGQIQPVHMSPMTSSKSHS
jgi:hypothetical protein